MDWLMDWLKAEPTELHEYLVISFIIVLFGLTFAAIGFFHLGKRAGGKMFDRTHTVREHGVVAGAYKMYIFLVGEECFYRYLVNDILFRMSIYDWDVIGWNALASVAFGLLPPHNVLPLRTRIAVMCGGFILSLLYLKTGGWNGGSPLKPLLITLIAHAWVSGIIAGAFAFSKR